MQNNDKSGLSWSTPSQPAKSQGASNAPSSSSSPSPKSLPPAKQTSSGSSTAAYAGILVAGIIIGVLIAWGYSAATNRPSASTVASTTQMASDTRSQSQTSATTQMQTSGETVSNLITLPSPQKAGLSVAIDKVTVAQPTWAVVYDNVGGKPGNALGASLVFSSGPATVTLLRATQPGVTYFVGLSTDNGDHKFAKAADPAVLSPNGSVALTSFDAN